MWAEDSLKGGAALFFLPGIERVQWIIMGDSFEALMPSRDRTPVFNWLPGRHAGEMWGCLTPIPPEYGIYIHFKALKNTKKDAKIYVLFYVL